MDGRHLRPAGAVHLEDPAGNRIGRAFEIENFGPLDSSPAAQTVRVAFSVTES
jgi:hypothetical protein